MLKYCKRCILPSTRPNLSINRDGICSACLQTQKLGTYDWGYKERKFVVAAKVIGLSDMKIIFRHIIPNLTSSLIVISATNFAASILIESGLSFLGIGVQPPMSSWGLMIKDHYNYIILGKAYLAIIPGLCIMLLVSSFMILGNSIERLYNKKYA